VRRSEEEGKERLESESERWERERESQGSEGGVPGVGPPLGALVVSASVGGLVEEG